MSAPVPTRSFVVLHLLGCSILWASGFLFIKLVGTLHPFVIAASRGILGAAALMAWFAWEGRRIAPRGEERRHWIVLGALNGWVPNILVAYALTQISAAFGAMIQTSSPLMTAFIAHALFADERLTGRRALGLLVGFAGMAILVGPAALPDSATSMAGTLAMIAAAASYAAGGIYARAIRAADPSRLALGQQVGSAIPATLLALAVVGPAEFASAPAYAMPLFALGVFATALPILLFMRLIRGAGATRAAMVGYLLPVWTTLLALVFLGETVGLREIIGGAVILIGVAIVSLGGRTAR